MVGQKKAFLPITPLIRQGVALLSIDEVSWAKCHVRDVTQSS